MSDTSDKITSDAVEKHEFSSYGEYTVYFVLQERVVLDSVRGMFETCVGMTEVDLSSLNFESG